MVASARSSTPCIAPSAQKDTTEMLRPPLSRLKAAGPGDESRFSGSRRTIFSIVTRRAVSRTPSVDSIDHPESFHAIAHTLSYVLLSNRSRIEYTESSALLVDHVLTTYLVWFTSLAYLTLRRCNDSGTRCMGLVPPQVLSRRPCRACLCVITLWNLKHLTARHVHESGDWVRQAREPTRFSPAAEFIAAAARKLNSTCIQ